MLYLLRLMYGELSELNTTFYRDPRTSHLPLVGSPVPMVCILALYIRFVKKWGPALMANRKPMELKIPMQIYNVMQVLLNLYAVVSSKCFLYDFGLLCHPYDIHDTGSIIMNIRTGCYVYYITKYLDLLDTVFKQISFLHVYHHIGMVYGVWAYMTLIFGSHYTLDGIIYIF